MASDEVERALREFDYEFRSAAPESSRGKKQKNRNSDWPRFTVSNPTHVTATFTPRSKAREFKGV